jgi:hypothetical protein
MQQIDALYGALQGQLSGERALDTATAIARYNRITGSSDFAAAVEMLAAQLRGAQVDSVTVERFATDGVQKYMGRTFAPAYEAHSARLRVVSPSEYTICDYAETPMCLPSNTPATPPGGVTAQVIDVGRGDRLEDYAGLEVAGKAVMATGLTTDVYNLAVEQLGAACVMTTNMYDWSNLPQRKRSMIDLPDATHLARLYHDPQKARKAPAFSITFRHAEKLRGQLARGPVTIHATVDAENKAGELLVLDATIQGSDLAQEEVWMLAHLCHPKPGACDNGSGVALGVEIFRAIAAAIHAGTSARPRRTLRLLLLPEVSGTQAYMERFAQRPDRAMDKVVAGINLDMVGANTAVSGAYLRVVQTPWSRPSFLNHLAGYLLEKTSLGSTSHIRREPVRDWLYSLAPYDKGSDHDVLLNSRFGIPSLFFFNWPYRYYHTDLDTPDKLDAGEFARTGVVAGTLALVAASLKGEMAREALALVRDEAVHGLARLAHGSDPGASAGSMEAHQLRLSAQAEMEHGALHSVMAALPPHERGDLYVPLSYALAAINEWRTDKSPSPDPRIPARVEPWPLNLGSIAHGAGKEQLAALRARVVDFDDKGIAALNYADGVRNVGQIARLVAGELGDFALDDAAAWFDLLAACGVVTLA